VCGARADGTTPTMGSELDLVQAEIARYKQLRAADLATRTNPFPQLAVDYLRAFEPLVQEGQPFSIMEGDDWAETKVAFKRRIEQDRREWHPLFALTFVEAILGQPVWGCYALILQLEGNNAQEAFRRRKRERALLLLEEGHSESRAERMADTQIQAESTRLREVIFAIVEENIVRVLVQSLHVDPISPRLNVVERVSDVLETIATQGRYGPINERVREGGGSHTLPEAIHEIAGEVLINQELDPVLKKRRFGQLLELFVMLQNEPSRDYLLLLFGDFDVYDRLLGDAASFYDEILNRKTADFVLASLRRDPEGELGLDAVDQLTRWIVRRLELSPDGLLNERIVDVLLLLREERTSTLKEYLERFYRDFHAFNPAGYETVIFQLVSILVQYAELDVFVRSDKDAAAGEPPPGAELPPHEKVMTVLRWYNETLGKLAHTLPEIDLDFVEREQRAVLEKILGYLESNVSGPRPPHPPLYLRFIETMLQLVKRIAHVADPDEIETRILEPFAKARGFDHDLRFRSRNKRTPSTISLYLTELATIVAQKRGE
jgi:hypothetical protein